MMATLPDSVRDVLTAHAAQADRNSDWPAASWAALTDAGLLAAAVPVDNGGTGTDSVATLTLNEAIAAACPTTAFILSQREAAIRRLLAGPVHLQKRYLPAIARGELFTTVGVSQLTTSRQHGTPAVQVTLTETGFRLEGETPWVTAADRADVLILGGTLPDQTQAVFAVPARTPGLHIPPPMDLAALAGSRTATVQLENVELDSELLLAGPTREVLGRTGGGGLDTSNLALGVAHAAVQSVAEAANARPDLVPVAAQLNSEVTAARTHLHRLAAAAPDPDAALAHRATCTQLALRVTQVNLLVAKGAGFVNPHPAGRLARQALFFLVWSCPRPVADGVLGGLLETDCES